MNRIHVLERAPRKGEANIYTAVTDRRELLKALEKKGVTIVYIWTVEGETLAAYLQPTLALSARE